MAPLPENSTGRLFVDYTTKGQAHTILFRAQTGIASDDLVEIAQNFITELLPSCYNETTFNGARWSAVGSDFSLPVPWTVLDGTLGLSQPDQSLPNFIGFPGRGITTGRRTNIRVFGTNAGIDATFRVEPPIGITLDQARDVLVAATGVLGTIGGDNIVWQQYVNLGVDAYYQRKARTG